MVTNIFILIGGSVCFIVAVILHSQDIDFLLNLFQKLWDPLFIPSINLFFLGATINFIVNQSKKGHAEVSGI